MRWNQKKYYFSALVVHWKLWWVFFLKSFLSTKLWAPISCEEYNAADAEEESPRNVRPKFGVSFKLSWK